MSSTWFSSWFPALPSLNFSFPSRLQGRFVSFILKKFLGHFLKPGQLDAHQVDSQIGSGYVQINELELDEDAINAILSDLPIRLHDGSLASIVVRIPFPNPLTSSIGLTLQSLHLTFKLVTLRSQERQHYQESFQPLNSLADSVASVAEAFVHDELGPSASVTLAQPTSSTGSPDNSIPGSLGSFGMGVDEQGQYIDTDPAGISIFATLIERFLAKFEFEAVDTRITLMHPDNTSITISLEEMRYKTQVKSEEVSGLDGEIRNLTLTGLQVHLRDMHAPPDPFSDSPVVDSPRASTSFFFDGRNEHHELQTHSSPSSSTSSLDEETQMAMSQSLAFLPPRSISPTASTASSMYHSAFSVAPTIREEDEHEEGGSRGVSDAAFRSYLAPLPEGAKVLSSGDRTQEHRIFVSDEELVLSFGNAPISIQLRTPPPVYPQSEQASATTSSASVDVENLDVRITIGVIACVLRPWHVRAFLQLADGWESPQVATQKQPAPNDGHFMVGMGLKMACEIRGVVFLLLPRNSLGETWIQTGTDVLGVFFSRPLVPPKMLKGYLRLFFDALSLQLHLPTLDGRAKLPSFSIQLQDFSLFSFQSVNGSPGISALPILISDPLLSTQYSCDHTPVSIPAKADVYPSLPIFEVTNWTHENYRSSTAKLSTWRTKSKPKHSKTTPEVNATDPPGSPHLPLIYVQGLSSMPESESRKRHYKELPIFEIEVQVSPLHFFVDLGFLLYDEIVPAFQEEISTAVAADLTPPATPLTPQLIHNTGRNARGFTPRNELPTTYSLNLILNMIRIQVRTPSPPKLSAQRSGSFVVDLHRLVLTNRVPPPRPMARFEPFPSLEQSTATIDIKRIVLAYSLAGERNATTFLSIGSRNHYLDALGFLESNKELSNPHVQLLRSPNTGRREPLIVSVVLPSLHVQLTKPVVDGLQFWADDLTQLFEARSCSTHGSIRTEKIDSIIGSRFFVNSQADTSTFTTATVDPQNQLQVRVKSAEVFIRFMVPRISSKSGHVFDVGFAELDVKLQVSPEGRDETVLQVDAVEIAVQFANEDGIVPLLSLTAARTLFLEGQPKLCPPVRESERPLAHLIFISKAIRGTTLKETSVRLVLSGFTFNVPHNLSWAKDLEVFAKNPPGTFETVVPTERSSIKVKVDDGTIRAYAPNHPGVAILYIDGMKLSTIFIGTAPESNIKVKIKSLDLLAIEDTAHQNMDAKVPYGSAGLAFWKRAGFAHFVELANAGVNISNNQASGRTEVVVNEFSLKLELCADTISEVANFANDVMSAHEPSAQVRSPVQKPRVMVIGEHSECIMASIEDLAFKQAPEIGPTPDMIDDDLPTNADYLDDTYGAAAGVRALSDEEGEDSDDGGFDLEDALNESMKIDIMSSRPNPVAKARKETIKVLRGPIRVEEYYFEHLTPERGSGFTHRAESKLSLIIRNGDVKLCLFDGYDWKKTRKVIEDEVRVMRRRLAKIRQLVASGQTQDPDLEEASAVLFNSVYIGLDQDAENMEPDALLAAIDDELGDEGETASQSSWQTLPQPSGNQPKTHRVRVNGKPLNRSSTHNIEFRLSGLGVEYDQCGEGAPFVSRSLITVRDLEIIDRMTTSTWNKFLTQLRSDSHGNIRETGSNMVRIELLTVQPVPGNPAEEARLRVKLLPLRLHVDQNALDFLKKFFSFQDSTAEASEPTSPDGEGIYFQLAEVFPVDLKLDYKPRRVDYRALKEGRTIELMNFFHFDGAEMTLRHITLFGVTGWPRFFDSLNDLWTPDVKATQLVDVISGVAPIRSVVNVGSGVADLVLLPIAQYKKDGRIVRGMQKGTTAFVRSTAIEAIKMGARLATGTQVILEQAENVLGGQFSQPTEVMHVTALDDDFDPNDGEHDEERVELISKYAQQPMDVKEGMQDAYRSLRKNLNSAAETILAVPMEVYERSGNEGAVRSVIRAVPIVVLRPMIGASEAISKTLQGLHNTLDPNLRHDNEAKYKRS